MIIVKNSKRREPKSEVNPRKNSKVFESEKEVLYI